MNESKKISINFIAEAVVANKNNIKTGEYEFNDPEDSNNKCIIDIFFCSGIELIPQGSKTLPSKKAGSKDNFTLAMGYKLSCQIKIPNDIQLFPTKNNALNWPRSSEGRRYLEDAFLTRINYFFDSLMYISSQYNPDHEKLMNIRPIGSKDIITIIFYINDKCVAVQGNSLFERMLKNKINNDDDLWNPNDHLVHMLLPVPIEHKLLTRSYVLLNIGFYQEAILVAFSVLDAKLRELIEKRIQSELALEKKEIKEYLMNIPINRLDTFFNFLFKLLDKTSLKSKEKDLFNDLKKINRKRNQIVHNGESATREEAANSILIIARAMEHLNKYHKGDFKIPKELLNANIFSCPFTSSPSKSGGHQRGQ
jgi:hypothetical protein